MRPCCSTALGGGPTTGPDRSATRAGPFGRGGLGLLGRGALRRLVLAEAVLVAATTPVPGDRQRIPGNAALVEQVPAEQLDHPGLARHERVHRTRRGRE